MSKAHSVWNGSLVPRSPHTAALYRRARGVAILSLVVNVALSATKLVGGVVGQSFALISDAVNSLGDVLASSAVLFGLWLARKPADAEHPYGHTRAEAIAASNVALLMILSALAVGWHAIRQINHGHDVPPAWTLWIAAGNVLIKEILYHYNVRVGNRIGSRAMIASAWDHRSDALCSLAVLIGLALVRWAGPNYLWLDEAAALVVVTLIVWTGTSLFRTTASELMDLQADDAIVRRIRALATGVAGVQDVETLWVRKSGMEYFVDIHIEVNAELTVAEGHEIGHRVKDVLLQQDPMIRDALVHLEPHPHEHAAVRNRTARS
jgi:cation diffusion facilitator family transporter